MTTYQRIVLASRPASNEEVQPAHFRLETKEIPPSRMASCWCVTSICRSILTCAGA